MADIKSKLRARAEYASRSGKVHPQFVEGLRCAANMVKRNGVQVHIVYKSGVERHLEIHSTHLCIKEAELERDRMEAKRKASPDVIDQLSTYVIDTRLAR